MIRFTPKGFRQADWDAAAAGFDGGNLMQSWAYGEAKAAADGWQVERGVLTDEAGATVGIAQTLLRPLPVVGGGLAWINRGPLVRPSRDGFEPALYGAALDALREHYAERGGYYLRIAPGIRDGEVATLSVNGFSVTAAPGWASAVLDLAPDAGELRAGLRQNWRNGLNRAERGGARLVRGTDESLFEAFLAEYAAFVTSRGIETTVTVKLLRALQQTLPTDRKMSCYRAFDGGTPLGSALIVHHGDTAEYLAGTLLDAGRPFSIGQLLLWRAIEDARSAGLRRFDLGGMDAERTPRGIYDFKRGVSGAPYRLMPEIEARPTGLRARLVRWRVRRARGENSVPATAP